MHAKNLGKGLVATNNIVEGDIFDSEQDILSTFHEKDIFECSLCEEQYDDFEAAEECCREEDE